MNGRSRWFGSGKVNASRAVARARALPGGVRPGGTRHGSAQPGEPIPDRDRQGIVSHINLTGDGPVRSIEVEVDITHTYRGDLRVSLVSPQGFTASLHNMQGSFRDDLQRTYTAGTNSDLARFVRGEIEGKGRWTLHVSDNLSRDTGTLNAWRIDLR